jgi:probable F420-dependent oxidoreductase
MHPGRAVAERIGRVGLWSFQFDRMTAESARRAAARIEAIGAGALWIPESLVSKELFSHITLLLAATDRIPLVSGIANIWARDAVAMQNGARALAEEFPGRFILGLGVSHEPVVRRRGQTYERPLTRMREYLDAMDHARYAGPEPAEPAPRLLAALGPRMLRLAAERTSGAHPYFVPVEHTPFARKMLGEGPLLAVEQAVVFETDPLAAREIAKGHMSGYLRLDNYANNLKRLGWSEDDIAGPSDRLVDAIVAWGPSEVIVDRIQSHLAHGADHVCIQPISRDPAVVTFEPVSEIIAAIGPNNTIG